MNLNKIAVVVTFLLVLGSLGLGYSIQQTDTPTTNTQSGTPANNTTVNGTILVSESSQNLIVVTNITNKTNNTTENRGDDRTGTISRDWTQITKAGSIPHVVQDGSGVQYYAYCLEPAQKAQVGADLTPLGPEKSAVILKTIKNSDPSNGESATSAQMKIWVLVTGGNTDTSTGEGASYTANMTQSEIQSGLNQAKTEIMNEYRVSEDQIGTLVEYKPMDITGSAMVTNLALQVEDTLNVNPGRFRLNVSNNTTNITNNTTNQTNQSNFTNETTTQTNTTTQTTSNNSGTNMMYIILRFFNLGAGG